MITTERENVTQWLGEGVQVSPSIIGLEVGNVAHINRMVDVGIRYDDQSHGFSSCRRRFAGIAWWTLAWIGFQRSLFYCFLTNARMR